MSKNGNVISLQLGQCGNQVGAQLYNTLADEAYDGSDQYKQQILNQFFRESRSSKEASLTQGLPIARSCLIDMEPKVIQHSLDYSRQSSRWRFSPLSTFSKQSGSANNWAYGYNIHGPAVHNDLLNIIRREVEECDWVHTCVVLQSLAGGTGSGLGSYVTEQMKVWYPKVNIINQVVWPYDVGEVIVQNLNTLLTLASLHEHTDGVLVVENDVVYKTATQLIGLAKPSFQEMNVIIAQYLSSVLLPSSQSTVSFTPQTNPYFKKQQYNNNKNKRENNLDLYNQTMDILSSLSFPTANPSVKDTQTTKTPHFSSSSSSKSNTGLASSLQCPLSSSVPQLCLDSVAQHVFSHPSFKLSTLSVIPQVAQRSKAFESTTWPYIVKHLCQSSFSSVMSTDRLIDWSLSLKAPVYTRSPYGSYHTPHGSYNSAYGFLDTPTRAPYNLGMGLGVGGKEGVFGAHEYIQPIHTRHGLHNTQFVDIERSIDNYGDGLGVESSIVGGHNSVKTSVKKDSARAILRSRLVTSERSDESASGVVGAHGVNPTYPNNHNEYHKVIEEKYYKKNDDSIPSSIKNTYNKVGVPRPVSSSSSNNSNITGVSRLKSSKVRDREQANSQLYIQSQQPLKTLSNYIVFRGTGSYNALQTDLTDSLFLDDVPNTLENAEDFSHPAVLERRGGRDRYVDAPSLGFMHPSLYSDSSVDPLLCAFNEETFTGDQHMGAVWGCSQKIISPLDNVLSKSWDMFSTGAYIHHYKQCGIEEDDFMNHFASLENVLSSYRTM